MNLDDDATIIVAQTSLNEFQMKSLAGYDNWVRVETFGFNGGIWILWSEIFFKWTLVSMDPQFVTCNVLLDNGDSLLVSFMYANPDISLRRRLWHSVWGFNGSEKSWLLLGDFNSFASAVDQTGYVNVDSAGASDFRQWIFDNSLIDLGFKGTPFTWSKGGINSSYKAVRLDHCLCTEIWHTIFSRVTVINAPKLHSDHCPIFMNCFGVTNSSVRRFHFQTAWTARKDFIDEELYWFQQSSEDWIVFGERNTRFYHLSTVIKRKKQQFLKLKNGNNVWIEDSSQLKELSRGYYQELYSKDLAIDCSHFVRPDGHTLSSSQRVLLHRSFSHDEVYDALRLMSPYKASGTDNLQAFRPISLCNVIYKLVTKVLVNKLKDVLSSLIGPEQSSFVPGRQIINNIVVFQEVLHTMRTSK
ncbi:uncharacterized protein LOC110604828 [Manihot esculenta]|uniref:uncharacterized protein LOC110604828 n=1 Tax=Manihot esculenta TaxID=3983 RepID=UPI000B5D6B02|nr:uncharacterized protein LOC110604828 [Manihot esculenta]